MTIDNGATHTARDATVTITGTSSAPINSPVRVTVDGQVLTTEVTSAATWSVTTAALTAGTRTVVAKVRDPAGNGATATQELTVELNPSPVALGSAATFSVLAGTSVVNTGTSTLSGDLGISPATAVSGFGPGTFAGTLHAGDGIASAARTALDAAITDASIRAPHTQFTGDLTGRTFNRGVHHTSAAFALTGTLTLDARGDPNAVFIFQVGAAFNTAAASAVTLVNGAQASNVFWVVTDAAGLGANSTFAGTLMARGAITIGEAATVRGQVLTPASVTLANNAFTGIVGAQ
jgi:cytoskeletal protein CcmA (bactofilin family)